MGINVYLYNSRTHVNYLGELSYMHTSYIYEMGVSYVKTQHISKSFDYCRIMGYTHYIHTRR